MLHILTHLEKITMISQFSLIRKKLTLVLHQDSLSMGGWMGFSSSSLWLLLIFQGLTQYKIERSRTLILNFFTDHNQTMMIDLVFFLFGSEKILDIFHCLTNHCTVCLILNVYVGHFTSADTGTGTISCFVTAEQQN